MALPLHYLFSVVGFGGLLIIFCLLEVSQGDKVVEVRHGLSNLLQYFETDAILLVGTELSHVEAGA